VAFLSLIVTFLSPIAAFSCKFFFYKRDHPIPGFGSLIVTF